MHVKYFCCLLLVLTVSFNARSADTLFTNPHYPPITYQKGEYNYYKYTAKYIPSDLLQAFKILGTHSVKQLNSFIDKTEEEVLIDGIYSPNSRIQKEFGLAGYSQFSSYFHDKGIYDPYLMESYLILAFHQYLNQKNISWAKNKRTVLAEHKKMNRKWKKRTRKLFKKGKVVQEKTKQGKDKRANTKDIPDFGLWQEYDEE